MNGGLDQNLLNQAIFRRPGVLGQNQYMPLSRQYQMPQWSNPMWRPAPVQMPQQPQFTGGLLSPAAQAFQTQQNAPPPAYVFDDAGQGAT